MSSILDALRKLEQEKSVRDQISAGASVRELALEPELELGGGRSERSSVRTVLFVFTGALVTLGIGAGIVAAGVMITRRDEPVQRVAAIAPGTGQDVAAVITTVKPVDAVAVAPEADSAAPKPAIIAKATPPKEITLKKSEPKATPKPEPKAEPKSVPPAPRAEPIAPVAQVALAPDQPATVGDPDENDISKLPILSEAVRVQLGLPPLKINIVGIPNERNPRASALINMQKVYVGENIPGTSARLMDVDLRGVSLVINGQRYFLSRR